MGSINTRITQISAMITRLAAFRERLGVKISDRLTNPYSFEELISLAPLDANRDPRCVQLERILIKGELVDAYAGLSAFGMEGLDNLSEALRAEEIAVTSIAGTPYISPWDLRLLLANFGDEPLRKHANYIATICYAYQEMRVNALMAEIEKLTKAMERAPASHRRHLEERLSQLSQARDEAQIDTLMGSMPPVFPNEPWDVEETESNLDDYRIDTMQEIMKQLRATVSQSEESLEQAESRLDAAMARLVSVEKLYVEASEAVSQSDANVRRLKRVVQEAKELLLSMEPQALPSLAMTLDELSPARAPIAAPRGQRVQMTPPVPRIRPPSILTTPSTRQATFESPPPLSTNPIRDAARRCTFPAECTEPRYLAATFEIEKKDTILIRVFPNMGQSLEILMKRMREQMANGCAIAIPPVRFVAPDARDDIRAVVVVKGTEYSRETLKTSGRLSAIHFQPTMIRVKKTSGKVVELVQKALSIYASELKARSFQILESETTELQDLQKPISTDTELGEIIASMQFE